MNIHLKNTDIWGENGQNSRNAGGRICKKKEQLSLLLFAYAFALRTVSLFQSQGVAASNALLRMKVSTKHTAK